MSEEKQVTVRVVRGFLNDGAFVDEGVEFTCGEMRARDLERNHLVERIDGDKTEGEGVNVEQKKAQEPANKRAKEPKNKS